MFYFVYLLECADKSIYTGITTDVARRFDEHKKGLGARYTRAHGAKKILYFEPHKTRSVALKREAENKTLAERAEIRIIEIVRSPRQTTRFSL